MDAVAKKRTIKVRNPLDLLTTLSGMAVCLVVGGYGWAAVTTLFGGGTLFGYGHDAVPCVATGDMGLDSDSGNWLLRPHAGIEVVPTHVNLCTQNPSAGQRLWYTLENLPGTVTLIVAVLVTYLALQRARNQGPYSSGFAAKLRFLGWFLLADSVLRPTIQIYASRRLWTSMADGPMDHSWQPVWACLLAGIALVTLARIMTAGTAMREDLEGVV
ncbi:hypothetical protein ABH926_001946 [Catenulispora sp. GP43]|uniref:hypothetical protein n=1 Tax=Catenulispora sp. GP43 TaxID=3156263 RepID=UPI003515EAF6